MKHAIWLVLILLSVAACAPNPRDTAVLVEAQAEAARTEALTAQDVLDRQAAREQQERLDAIIAQETAIRQAELTEAIRLIAIMSAVGLSGLLLALALAAAIISIGSATARTMADIRRASEIKLDPVTRQYPILVANNSRHLANPNNGQVLALNMRNEPDRLMVKSAGAVQLAGAIAREAAGSSDPASVALVRPVLVGDDRLPIDNDNN